MLRDRCNNPNSHAYSSYGGRGIEVSPEWNASFEAFYAHVGPRPSAAHSIDRMDVNGHYEPGNVQWATRSQQQLNRRPLKNHSTGYPGVNKDGSKFRATMVVDGKYVLNEKHDSLEDAIRARRDKEIEILGRPVLGELMSEQQHIVKVCTIQMGKWRLAKDHGIDLVDTTHASRFQLFSPVREAVYAYKNGTIDEEEYSKIYRQTLINSWQSKRQNWMDFLQAAPMSAMACYCAPDKFCHRHLLVKFLEQLCKQLGIGFEYYGEITDTTHASKD